MGEFVTAREAGAVMKMIDPIWRMSLEDLRRYVSRLRGDLQEARAQMVRRGADLRFLRRRLGGMRAAFTRAAARSEKLERKLQRARRRKGGRRGVR